ncbi:MAG: hypothetical protein Q9174_005148 [Haloplaca sp. 1 TL-2023]
MATIRVPENGILLRDAPCSDLENDHDASTQPQVMRLDLADGVLEGIMKASRMGKDIHMSFGKNVTLHYGTRSQQLLSIAQPTHSELYHYNPNEEDEFRFAGLMTHKLAQKKVQENTAGADAALAALQSKMASHQQNKQSKQIKVLGETPKASPTITSTQSKSGGNDFFASLRGPGTKKPTTPLSGVFPRSTPGSPAMAAIRSGQATPNPTTSVPPADDNKSRKLQALKIPLLHLVAIRPMSLKFLANKVGCSQEECKQVLQKVGKPARLDPDKWDLSDKAFKDLDVWKFAYELDNDRELAVEHAISAYDRMRLSREDKLWQMLLPKEERGKGRILSKLQLHQGPIQQSTTPRIHVQKTTEAPVEDDLFGDGGDEKDRLAPADATPIARSPLPDPTKKKKAAAQEAQSKRLLSTKPKKATPTPQTKASKETTKNKVTKKGPSAGPNVKSTEFVHESDEEEDEGMKTAAASTPKPSIAKDQETKTKSEAKKPVPDAKKDSLPKKPPPGDRNAIKEPRPSEKDRKPTPVTRDTSSKYTGTARSPSTVGTPGSKHRPSDASQKSSSSSQLSRQRTTSSPLKPSPLGSSPPTNASDMDNDSQRNHTSNSSTSSTPLMSHARNNSSTSNLRTDTAGKGVSTPSQGSSDASLKRKANDMDSGIHNHKLTNGESLPANKRARTSAPSPSLDSSSSNSSPLPDGILEKAQSFKDMHIRYERLYREVSVQVNPSTEQIDRLVKMHQRLQSMKEDLSRDMEEVI